MHTEDPKYSNELSHTGLLSLVVGGDVVTAVDVTNRIAINVLPAEVTEIEYQPINQDLVMLSSYGSYDANKKIELMTTAWELDQNNCIATVEFGRNVTIKGVLVHLTDAFK